MPEIWYREILWVISVVIWICAYYPYIRDVLKWLTKPHLFSWIVFVIMDMIAFLIQFWDNAWPWSWGIFTTGVWAFVVMSLAVKYGEKHITKSDIFAFVLALISLVFYVILKNPLYSQLLVFSILLLAMYPTFRKSYIKPYEETLAVYTVAVVRSIISIFASINISFLTIGLPIFIICLNGVFVSMILVRRKQLWHKVHSNT